MDLKMLPSFDAFVGAYLEDLACRLEKAGLEVDLADWTLSFILSGETMPYLIKIHRTFQEIWLSSPFSGGNRFALEIADGSWKNVRTNQDFDWFLHQELSQNNVSFPLLNSANQ